MKPTILTEPSILVLDMIDLVRIGLRSVLREGESRVAKMLEARNVHEFESCLESSSRNIGLVIVGNVAPGELEQLRACRSKFKETPFCLLVDRLDDRHLAEGHALDVLGFLHISASPEEVRVAINHMLGGHVYLPRSIRPYLQLPPKTREAVEMQHLLAGIQAAGQAVVAGIRH